MTIKIDRIFQEYKRLRQHGLGTTEAINALRTYIDGISSEMRDILAQNMRAWENQRTEHISPAEREIMAQSYEASKSSYMSCPTCGKANLVSDAICYSCGQLLQERSQTERISDMVAEVFDMARFTVDNRLLLAPQIRGLSLQTIEVPIHYEGEQPTTLGRTNHTEELCPDINLIGLEASQLGISRIHAAIMFKDDMLYLTDLNSTNGSFLNEQKLHAKERRTIHDGDLIRLGNLVFKVIFK